MNNKLNTVNAAVVIIGNEILSGRTQDINLSYLSNWLNKLGVKVEESRIIPDIESVIIYTINELRKKFNYVFTTGGIGPTHDDITSQSISKAFDLEYVYHKQAYLILEKYYEVNNFSEGRKKMAKMPKNANLILNPASGAPGFYVENVFCLPGVPSILQSMLGGLKNVISGGSPILSKTINIRTVESEIARSLEKVQEKNKDVEIGSYPFFKSGKVGVAIVLRSEEQKKIDKCNNEILKFISDQNINLID